MSTGEGVQRKHRTYFEITPPDFSELCVRPISQKQCWTCVSFYLWIQWKKGLNWEGQSLEPLHNPGTYPKYSAVQDGAIWDISSYGSFSRSLQWKLWVSALFSFPSAVSGSNRHASTQPGIKVGWVRGCELMAVSRAVTPARGPVEFLFKVQQENKLSSCTPELCCQFGKH